MAKTPNKNQKEMPRYVYTGHEDIPNSYTEITGIEYKALLSVNSTDARWIYFVLSFHRDFETGIAGLNPKISSGMLRKTVSHKSDVGKKERSVSNNHIQRWLDQLEKAGLIEDRGNHVFYLPLARKHPRKENKSNRFSNTFSDSTVTVTKDVTGSSEKSMEQPVNTEENEKSEVLQNVLQDTSLSQQKEDNLSHILLPIQNNRLDKIRLDAPAEKFRQLLIERGFYLNHMTSPKTLAMIKLWVDSNVTVEEAEIAMNHADAQLGKRADHPSYYRDIPFQYRKELNQAKQKVEAIKHETRTTKQPTKQYGSVNARVSAAIAALPDEWED
jgi:hypothetical protein